MQETQEHKEHRLELGHNHQAKKEYLEAQVTSTIVEEEGERIEVLSIPKVVYKCTEVERQVPSAVYVIGYDESEHASPIRLATGGGWFLVIGALCNTSAVLFCVLSMTIVFSGCRDPALLVFNAVAAGFIYNLDDVGGELNVLSDQDWHGELLGRLQMLNAESHGPTESGFVVPSPATHRVYASGAAIMKVLGVFLPAALIFVRSGEPGGEVDVKIGELMCQ